MVVGTNITSSLSADINNVTKCAFVKKRVVVWHGIYIG